MTIESEENREILEEVNFGDEEGMPDKEPAGLETPPEPVEVAPEPDPEPPVVSSAEEKASAIGWRPQDTWKGDPDKWVSAEAFLKKGEEILPVMKADRERLFGEVRDLKQQVTDVLKYHKEDRTRIQERLRQEHDQAITDLKVQQRAAVEEGDTDTFDKLEVKKDALEAAQPVETPPGPAEGTQPPAEFDKAEFDTWQAQNKWYQLDENQVGTNEMTRAAQAMAYRVQAENPQLSGWSTQFRDKVVERVKLSYPEKFANPRREGAAGVEGAGGTGAVPRKNTYADLPSDAKEQCRNMKRSGMTEAEFVSEYFGEDAINLQD
jgi:hypothetical protein